MVSAYGGEVQGVVFSMFHMEMSIKVTFLFLGKRGFSINGIKTIDSYGKKIRSISDTIHKNQFLMDCKIKYNKIQNF